jgi:hypothetical protein
MNVHRIAIQAGMIFGMLLAGLHSGITAPFCIVAPSTSGAGAEAEMFQTKLISRSLPRPEALVADTLDAQHI